MAISRDTSAAATPATTTSLQWSHTVSSSADLIVGFGTINQQGATDTFIMKTSGGALFTFLGDAAFRGFATYTFYIINPPTGNLTIEFNTNSSYRKSGFSVSYIGASMQAQPNVFAASGGNSNIFSQTISPTIPNCWITGLFTAMDATPSISSGSILQTAEDSSGFYYSLFDSNGTVPAGSNTYTISGNDGAANGTILATQPPFAVPYGGFLLNMI